MTDDELIEQALKDGVGNARYLFDSLDTTDSDYESALLNELLLAKKPSQSTKSA